jgi:hypothetical protein
MYQHRRKDIIEIYLFFFSAWLFFFGRLVFRYDSHPIQGHSYDLPLSSTHYRQYAQLIHLFTLVFIAFTRLGTSTPGGFFILFSLLHLITYFSHVHISPVVVLHAQLPMHLLLFCRPSLMAIFFCVNHHPTCSI